MEPKQPQRAQVPQRVAYKDKAAAAAAAVVDAATAALSAEPTWADEAHNMERAAMIKAIKGELESTEVCGQGNTSSSWRNSCT